MPTLPEARSYVDQTPGHGESVDAEVPARRPDLEPAGRAGPGHFPTLARGSAYVTLLAWAALSLVSCAGPERSSRPPTDPPHPWRVGIRGSLTWSNRISSLTYNAPFQAQTLIYETLVKRDPDGRIVPGLASAWEFADQGRSVIFTLRAGATWHDGTPVTAEDVRIHFKRWLGLPEYDWIHASRNVREVVAESTNRLRVTMHEPAALLPDLCAIRPGAIGGPGCLDREGEWVKPVGSGPFRFVELREQNRVFRLQRVRPDSERAGPADYIDLVQFDAEATGEDEPFRLFRRGGLDVLVDGWKSRIPRDQVAWLKRQPGLHVSEAPGSVLHYLSFRLQGPTADLNLRRHIAAALDRAELIQQIEGGYADATHSWTAPTVKSWPQIPVSAPGAALPRCPRPLRLLGFRDRFRPREQALCALLARQLRRAGIPVEIEFRSGEAYKEAVTKGEYDVRTEITWGVPYDPDMSVKARFLPPTFKRPSGAGNRYFGVDPRAERLARQMAVTPDESDRWPLYQQLQQLLSDQALVVPLYVPRRLAVIRGRNRTMPLDHDVYRDALSALTD